MDDKLEEVKQHLRATISKIDAILDNPKATKSFTYINSLNFAKKNTEIALRQIAWLEDKTNSG